MVILQTAADSLLAGSVLGMPDVPMYGGGEILWGDLPVNWMLISLSALCVVLFLQRIVGISGYLVGGLFRWKPILKLEENMGLMRDRNGVAAIMLIPACLVASRYGLYAPDFMRLVPEDFRTLVIVGVVLAAEIVRALLIEILRSGKISRDIYGVANRSVYNFFILGVIAAVLTCGAGSFLGANDMLIRGLVYAEICLSLLIAFIRKTQILSNTCNLFRAILYLCALEILPAGLIVASALYL